MLDAVNSVGAPTAQNGTAADDDALTNIGWLMSAQATLPVTSDEHDPTTPPQTPPSPPVPISAAPPPKRKKRQMIDYSIQAIKPPHSYAQLITLAMKAHGQGEKVVLTDIYDWIRDNYAFFRQGDNSWQNSVRHNLSLNKQFIKVPRDPKDKGKGSYWRLDITNKDPYCIRRRNFANEDCNKQKNGKPVVSKPQVNPAVKSFLEQANLMLENGKTLHKRGLEAPIDVTTTTYTLQNDLLPCQGSGPPIYSTSSLLSPSTTDRVKVEYNWEAYDYHTIGANQTVGISLPLQLSSTALQNQAQMQSQAQVVNTTQTSAASSVGLSPSTSEETDGSTGLELRIPTPEWWGNQVTSASLLSPQNGCQNYLARVFETLHQTPTVTSQNALPPTTTVVADTKVHPWQDTVHAAQTTKSHRQNNETSHGAAAQTETLFQQLEPLVPVVVDDTHTTQQQHDTCRIDVQKL